MVTPKVHRKVYIVLSTLALIWALGFAPAYGDLWNQKTVVTIDAPLRIPGKVLPPGSYVFKLADSSSNRHIVRIFNEDQTKVYATILAIPDYRLQATGDTKITLWEMPAGPPALRAWFYPGKNYGNEIPYPRKAARMIAAATKHPVKAVDDELEKKMTETPSSPNEPVSEDLKTARVTEEKSPEEVTQVASAKPLAAAQPPNQKEMTSSETAKRLPQTASALPLIGLIGLLSGAGGMVLRLLLRRWLA